MKLDSAEFITTVTTVKYFITLSCSEGKKEYDHLWAGLSHCRDGEWPVAD